MKRTVIMCAAIGFIGLLVTSCASSKKEKLAADVYDDTITEETESEEIDGEVLAIEKSDKKSKSKDAGNKKKKKNVIEEFFTFGNRDEYKKFQEVSVCENDVTGMNERRAQTVIRTDNYMAGWGSYYLLAYYYIQFDDANRQKLLNAIDSYFYDFENKNLQRKGKNTERAYGKVSYRLDWGSVSATTPNHGTGDGYMGYKFMKGSPYFTIKNFPFKNDHFEDASETSNRESLGLTYYFTKSQLKNLVGFLSNENISACIAEMNEYFGYSGADEY